MADSNQSSKANSLIAQSAFLVSLCAIGLSVYEVNILEEQKHASVWPRVFAARNTANDLYQVMVKNAGVGPAQIRYVEVKAKSKNINSWREGLELIIDKKPIAFTKSTLSSLILLPGDSMNALTLDSRNVMDFYQNEGGFQIKICYCSIYERCWTVDESDDDYSGFPSPKPISKCPTKSDIQFLN